MKNIFQKIIHALRVHGPLTERELAEEIDRVRSAPLINEIRKNNYACIRTIRCTDGKFRYELQYPIKFE